MAADQEDAAISILVIGAAGGVCSVLVQLAQKQTRAGGILSPFFAYLTPPLHLRSRLKMCHEDEAIRIHKQGIQFRFSSR